MQGLYQLNATITHFLEGFLETAVPMIAGLAEVVGLFIIITSLAKASYHYVRATFFNDHHDFHHEMSSGLTTALEFLMSAEIAKTFLLRESGTGRAAGSATFQLRADEPAAALGNGGRPPPGQCRAGRRGWSR